MQAGNGLWRQSTPFGECGCCVLGHRKKPGLIFKRNASFQHLGGKGRQISEFEASLVYRVSSKTARATQRNPVSKNYMISSLGVVKGELVLRSPFLSF